MSLMLQVEKSNANIVVCDAEIANWAKEAIDTIKSSTETDVDLFSLGNVHGIENILQKLESLENTVFLEPVKVDDIETNVCLIFWNSEINSATDTFEKITHAEAFLLSMKLCIEMKYSTKDIIEGYNIFDKKRLLLALCALERKLQFALNGIKSQSESLSPIPTAKPYTFKRTKIRFTIDDLENEEDEDDVYEHKKIELPKRLQPKRNCQNNQKFVNDKSSSSDSSSDEISVDLILDQEKYDYKIKEYYDKHGTNPPWQKNRGGIFACPHCNLDCKTGEGLKKHLRFYHEKWANSNESGKESGTQSVSHSDTFHTDDESHSENSSVYCKPDKETCRKSEHSDENFEEYMSRNIDHDSSEQRNWEVNDIHDEGMTTEKNPKSCNNTIGDSPKERKDDLITCWYCRKVFEKGPIYDNHYSICYDNYTYLHM